VKAESGGRKEKRRDTRGRAFSGFEKPATIGGELGKSAKKKKETKNSWN